MPAHEYMGYTVVVNALPGPNNRYYSVFSIHLDSPGVPPDQVALVYQEGIQADVICETSQEANEDAAERATGTSQTATSETAQPVIFFLTPAAQT